MPKMADEVVDQGRKRYERFSDIKAAMQGNLAWEIELLPRIKRDVCRDWSRYQRAARADQFTFVQRLCEFISKYLDLRFAQEIRNRSPVYRAPFLFQ
jgi:hypothetical protein